KAAQGRLHTAEQYWHIAVSLTDAVGVDDGGAVRAHARPAAGGIYVAVAGLFRHGVVVDHGVDDPGGDEKAEAWAAKALKVLTGMPVRLRQHGHAVTGLFQHAGDDGQPEGGVIDVGVAGDVDKVRRVPAPRAALGQGDGQKAHACTSSLPSMRASMSSMTR